MDREQILREQVAELEKLVALKDQRLRELEAARQPAISQPLHPFTLPWPPVQTYTYQPTPWW